MTARAAAQIVHTPAQPVATGSSLLYAARAVHTRAGGAARTERFYKTGRGR